MLYGAFLAAAAVRHLYASNGSEHNKLNVSLVLAELAKRFKITKYPTLKLFRYGEALRREYRGTRSADAFLKYLEGELISPVVKRDTRDQMEQISVRHRTTNRFASLH